MNAEQAIDLGTPPFWFAVLAAIVVIVPIVHVRARPIAIAIVDVAFAVACVGIAGAPVVVAVIAAVFAMCRIRRAWVVAVALLCAAFVFHKLPGLDVAPDARGALTSIGFSYVVLRAIDLVRTVADGRQPPPSLPDLVGYLIPFHMLAAGPIQSYDDFRAQPAVAAPLSVPAALDAVDRIAGGLFKKFVLAQAVHEILLTGFAADSPYLILEVQAYYLWVYLDFSAYSDIAVGIGKLLGRATPENFAGPLAARNITVFWERWHISLSLFIRKNLFLPIQLALGRRWGAPIATASVAITISFVLCGLWHGLSLRFLAWGGLHAAGLVATHLYRHALQRRLGRKGVRVYLARPWIRVLATVLTFEFIAFSLAFIVYPF